jgi:hypothetical protein
MIHIEQESFMDDKSQLQEADDWLSNALDPFDFESSDQGMDDQNKEQQDSTSQDDQDE